MVVELVPLSRVRTRVAMDVELNPKNLPAKLLVQSLKLARKNLSKRLNERLASYAAEVESRFKKTA